MLSRKDHKIAPMGAMGQENKTNAINLTQTERFHRIHIVSLFGTKY